MKTELMTFLEYRPIRVHGVLKIVLEEFQNDKKNTQTIM